jgi:hypothetical protein
LTDETPPAGKKPMLGNKAYDRWKFVAQIVLPALGTLYFALSSLWNLPAPEQVIGTITALDIFLGALLAYASKTYVASDDQFDGTLVINMTDPEKDTYSMEFSTPLWDITEMKTISLKVDTTK